MGGRVFLSLLLCRRDASFTHAGRIIAQELSAPEDMIEGANGAGASDGRVGHCAEF